MKLSEILKDGGATGHYISSLIGGMWQGANTSAADIDMPVVGFISKPYAEDRKELEQDLRKVINILTDTFGKPLKAGPGKVNTWRVGNFVLTLDIPTAFNTDKIGLVLYELRGFEHMAGYKLREIN